MTDGVVRFQQVLAAARDAAGESRWGEAARWWEEVVAANPVHGRYWAGLADARFSLGEYEAAAQAWGRVLELGMRPAERDGEKFAGGEAYLVPGEVAWQIARCHAALAAAEVSGSGEAGGSGHAGRAVAALADAVDRGFRDLHLPVLDDHWRPLLDNPRVRELLGLVDTEGLSRDEGWRTDLAFFAREVTRRAYAPFARVSREEFGGQVAALRARIPELTDQRIALELRRLITQFGDGHAFVLPGPADQDSYPVLPLSFWLFEEGLHVTAAGGPHRDLAGARVDRVAGHDPADVLATLGEYLSRDNDQQIRFQAPIWLRLAPDLHALGLTADPAEVELTVTPLDGGPARTVTVAAVPTRLLSLLGPPPPDWASLPDLLEPPVPLYLRNRGLPYWFEYLPADDLLWFQFNAVRDYPGDPFARFCDRLLDFVTVRRPGRLVIDLRWNGGGDTFLGQRLLHGLVGCPQVNRPGALFVIIGRNTFSAAQNIATLLEQHTAATFVGEPTGSRPNFIGETIPFQLPVSKLLVNVADLYWQTGYPMDFRPWIAPQLYAPPTFAAFRENRDPALAAILALRGQLPGL